MRQLMHHYVQNLEPGGPEQPATLGAHRPEQHVAPVIQEPHLPVHVAACAGVGAMIEVTSGMAIAAPMPMRRTASRREMRGTAVGHSTRSSSRWSRESASIANQTNSWPTFTPVFFSTARAISATVVRPSHLSQTAAAERFKQWALLRSRS